MARLNELLQAANDHGRAGRRAEAVGFYRQVLELDPGNTAALNNLGMLLLLDGHLIEARILLEQAVRLRPGYALAHNHLGLVWLQLGEFAKAEACFATALAQRPNLAVAHYNLGALLARLGRSTEAEVHLRQALRLEPDYAPAHHQLGVLLKDLGRVSEARAALEQAVRLEPAFVDALSTLASVLQIQARIDEARAVMDRALAIQPVGGLEVRSALLLPVVYESAEELARERSRLEARLEQLSRQVLAIDDPAGAVGTTPFFLAYQGKADRELHTRLAEILGRAAPALRFVAPHCGAGRVSERPTPIRIGFISSFFYSHSIGKLNLGLIRHLSRERFAVTLLRFPGPDDALSRAIYGAADRVVTLPRNLDAARRRIAAERLDVLYYTDIGMDPWTYFLAFARLASVQCVAWGHPVTSGIPAMDDFLSSRPLEPEDAARHYTEELVRLNKINTYYYEPKIEGPVKDRAALGLKSDVNLYVCPQSLFKIHPKFDDLLGAILRTDPRGRVVLIEGVCAEWRVLLEDRFRRSFPAEAGRVDFLPRLAPDDFLQLLARVDVLLDPTPFGGGTTSYDALSFGTPIVTMSGRQLRDRITSACFRQMGLLDCIAESTQEYVRTAVRLGTDSAWREQVRARILEQKHLIFEDIEAVRQLERFLLAAVARADARS